MIKIFSTSVCPKCNRLKVSLAKHGIEFESINVDDAAGLTEMFLLGIVTRDAPVLANGNTVLYTKDMFVGGVLDEERVLRSCNFDGA